MGKNKIKRGRPLETREKVNKVMRVSETTLKSLEEYGLKPNREIAIKKLLQIAELIKYSVFKPSIFY